MAIIPTVRSSNMRRSVAFYTNVLDFELASQESLDDPAYIELKRDGAWLILSSHSGDGVYGQAVVVTSDDVDSLFGKLRSRGLVTPGKPDSPVHEGPIEQSWGNREFYVDDPDGNTLRFVQFRTI